MTTLLSWLIKTVQQNIYKFSIFIYFAFEWESCQFFLNCISFLIIFQFSIENFVVTVRYAIYFEWEKMLYQLFWIFPCPKYCILTLFILITEFYALLLRTPDLNAPFTLPYWSFLEANTQAKTNQLFQLNSQNFSSFLSWMNSIACPTYFLGLKYWMFVFSFNTRHYVNSVK